MPVATDKKRVSLYLDEEIYEGLRRLAKERRRSMSNLIEYLCAVEIEKSKSSDSDNINVSRQTR
jgi:hypothetical protein